MSSVVISPYRVLPEEVSANSLLNQRFDFSSSGPDPKAKRISSTQYSLGTDSDWTAASHDLIIKCWIDPIPDLLKLFGDTGIVNRNGSLLLVLEWTSADSGTRQLGDAVELTVKTWPRPNAPIGLEIHLAAGAVRGVGDVSLVLFLGQPGSADSQSQGIAVQKGFRYGQLGTTIAVVIDGDSSLFPILEQACSANGPLWEFRESWSDPREDEFSSDYVSLVLNTDHELFSQLHERQVHSTRQPALMRQVLASWIAILIAEVMHEVGNDFAEIVGGNSELAEPYSIADTAAGFVRFGELDTSSISALFVSTQQWLDRRVKETDVSE